MILHTSNNYCTKVSPIEHHSTFYETMMFICCSLDMVNSCCVCRLRQGLPEAQGITFHRFPTNPDTRKQWLKALEICEENVCNSSRVCSRHFPFGIPTTVPSVCIGEKLGPANPSTDRAQRRHLRELQVKQHCPPSSIKKPRSSQADLPLSGIPLGSADDETSIASAAVHDSLNMETTANMSEQCNPLSATTVDALPCNPTTTVNALPCNPTTTVNALPCNPTTTVNALPCNPSSSVDPEATICLLQAEIQRLQVENDTLRQEYAVKEKKPRPLRIEEVQDNDDLIHLYTGFLNFQLLLAFFNFLGPAVNKLMYWGSKGTGKYQKKTKLDPLNQLFLVLMKLRRNLHVKDLAYRFGISCTSVSRYFITWICFLFHHLKEVDTFPSQDQVAKTLPTAFKEKYDTTFIIIDATEIYLETPSDMCLQSSTWSNYKHHIQAKY